MNIKSELNAKQTKTDTNGNQFHGKNRAQELTVGKRG